MVTKWFPKHEIRQMPMMFGSQETIHATYSYLNETLGLEDFEAFLHEPANAEKFELLTSTTSDWTHEDLQTNEKARQEVGRSLKNLFEVWLKEYRYILHLRYSTHFK